MLYFEPITTKFDLSMGTDQEHCLKKEKLKGLEAKSLHFNVKSVTF